MFNGFTPRTLAPPSIRAARNHVLPLALRQPSESGTPGHTHEPCARDAELATLEAVLLIADEPLPVRKLGQAAGLPDAARVRRLLKKLQELYDRDESAFELEELAGGFQLLTRPAYRSEER